MRARSVLVSGILLASAAASPIFHGSDSSPPDQEVLRYDITNRADDLTDKYFHESPFHAHYDARYASQTLPEDDQQEALIQLVKAYLDTCKNLGIQTWLMHGTLLGWWWGKKILPWDTDIDVQVSEGTIFFLAAHYNMSMFYYAPAGSSTDRAYMLEVNPHYTNREQTDILNTIDARWIDIQNGLFIDITAARYNLSHPGGEGMLTSKDGHTYRDTYLLPLRNTTFQGSEAKIPFKYKDMLAAEYGNDALTNTVFNSYIFDEEEMEWTRETTARTDL